MPQTDRRGRIDPAQAAPTRPPAPSPEPAHPVLALQRSHGNAAVARMLGAVLARDPVDAGVPPVAGVPEHERMPVEPPRAGDAADMDRAIGQYIYNEDWTEAARVLNGFNQADIDRRVRGYDVGWRSDLALAASVNGDAANRIRGACEFENSIFYHQWSSAARAMGTYPDQATIEPRLRALGLYDVAWMLHHAERQTLPFAATARAIAAEHAAEMTALVTNAVTTGDWPGGAVLLNTLPDPDLTAQLAQPPRTASQLFDLNAASDREAVTRIHAALSLEPTQTAIATEGLDRQLRQQIASADWAGVEATLGRYHDDAERHDRLQWFHLPEVTALGTHMRGGAVGVSASPFYPLVEARRVEKLGQEYAAAIASANWGYAVILLNSYNDADLLPKARDIQTTGGAAGVTAAANIARLLFSDDNHRVRRVLAFLPLESQAVPAPTHAEGMTNGPGAGTAVGGGTATAYEHVTDTSGDSDWFSFDYQGANAQTTAWLQFLAREAEMFDSDGNSTGFVHTETTAAGQAEARRWSTHDSPYWTIDTFGGAVPFYDAPSTTAVGGGSVGDRGAHDTSAAHTQMMDEPAINTIAQADAFDVWPWEDAPDHVMMRLRFHDYLVRGNEVLYENTMTVTWRLTSATDTPRRTNTAGTGATTDKLHTAHYQALIRRFPAWSFYNHG
ncbi:MAG: hypothetical protein QOE28_475 [Solirubrobacteraceae bacterium]|nr:hypothetical protein [Solirubrobacteraceae bacterium]